MSHVNKLAGSAIELCHFSFIHSLNNNELDTYNNILNYHSGSVKNVCTPSGTKL
jgi:hypothetical protein